MKKIKISPNEKNLILEMHQKKSALIIEQSIKYGMKDSGGSTKIKDLQTKLGLKNAQGKSLATGYFGDMTASALSSKYPDLYKGKNDIIDDQKYQKIISRIGTQTTNQNQNQNRNQTQTQTTQGGVKLTNTKITLNFGSLWKSTPGTVGADKIFAGIMPAAVKESPGSFGNACATRLSLGMLANGVKPDQQYLTEKDWEFNGTIYKKKSPITVRASSTPDYLKRNFGPPSFTGPNTQANVEKYIRGRNAVFVLTEVPQWIKAKISGHVDLVNSQLQCNNHCYWGEDYPGKLQVWYF